MTKREFEEELARVLRRAARLRAAVEGSADLQRVEVDGGWVRKHYRKKHTRIVIRLRKGGK